MKRQSKAEEALAREAKALGAQIDANLHQVELLGAQRATLMQTKDRIEIEIARLRQARLEASESKRPK